MSLSGNAGLIGAYGNNDSGSFSGSAYVFRHLDTADGVVTEDAKLTASDAAAGDLFGISASLAGSIGLVGAYGDDDAGSLSGSAYVFRNLDMAGGAVTESVKLTASDAATEDRFGQSVSVSGTIGLVGAYYDDDGGNNSGSAYLFCNLDNASGTVIEDIKLTASDGSENDQFGVSVSLDGDQFVIGTVADSGKAYTGSVSSVTTLDAGGASRVVDGISFASRTDWVIGETTDSNTVTLTSGDTANVVSLGMGVYVGKDAGSDFNTLVIAGTFEATEVFIGSVDGNEGNTLRLESTAAFTIGDFRLAPGSFLAVAGDVTDSGDFFAYLGAAELSVWDGAMWQTVTAGNYGDVLDASFAGGFSSFSSVTAVPEPAEYAVAVLVALGLVIVMRRRRGGPWHWASRR